MINYVNTNQISMTLKEAIELQVKLSVLIQEAFGCRQYSCVTIPMVLDNDSDIQQASKLTIVVTK